MAKIDAATASPGVRGQLRSAAYDDIDRPSQLFSRLETACALKARNMSKNSSIPAAECQTMVDVRAGVDALDQRLVELIAKRFGYMDAAARIKQSRDIVRDEARKAEVLQNVRKLADEAGLPEGLTDQIWEKLIESSIAYELEQWDKRSA
jgi:isochorismate pyruvate lyase